MKIQDWLGLLGRWGFRRACCCEMLAHEKKNCIRGFLTSMLQATNENPPRPFSCCGGPPATSVRCLLMDKMEKISVRRGEVPSPPTLDSGNLPPTIQPGFAATFSFVCVFAPRPRERPFTWGKKDHQQATRPTKSSRATRARRQATNTAACGL